MSLSALLLLSFRILASPRFGALMPHSAPSNRGICLFRSPAQQVKTPLHCAADRGDADVCALLLDRGASVEARDLAVRLCVLSLLLMLDGEFHICPIGFNRMHPRNESYVWIGTSIPSILLC